MRRFGHVSRSALLSALVLVLLGLITGCGQESSPDEAKGEPTVAGESDEGDQAEDGGAEEELGEDAAPDLRSCLADVTAAPTPYPDGFPPDWPWPDGTVVFEVDDRDDYGVVASAVTDLPFDEVLAFLNGPVQEAGFEVTVGETEESDAEADWASDDYHGRWAIRASATCPGETTIQVLSTDE